MITNTAKPSTSLTNTAKVSNSETWGTIATIWGSETRTWAECISLMENQTKPVTQEIVITDSYTDFQTIETLGYGYKGFGQSFTGDGNTLESVEFLISKSALPINSSFPTGTIYARIYAESHATAYGTDSKPTGTALAVSDGIDVSALSYSLSYVNFVFTGANAITLTNGIKYVVTLEYSSIPTNTDTLAIGFRYTSSTHAGNLSDTNNTGTWTARATLDLCFQIKATATTTNFITNTPKP